MLAKPLLQRLEELGYRQGLIAAVIEQPRLLAQVASCHRARGYPLARRADIAHLLVVLDSNIRKDAR
jgi:hypothetical protein